MAKKLIRCLVESACLCVHQSCRDMGEKIPRSRRRAVPRLAGDAIFMLSQKREKKSIAGHGAEVCTVQRGAVVPRRARDVRIVYMQQRLRSTGAASTSRR